MRTNYAVILEVKTRVSKRINLKAIVGFTSLQEEIGRVIASYTYVLTPVSKSFRPCYFDADFYEYSVVPFAIGLEYRLIDRNIPLCAILERGYNYYTLAIHTKQTYFPAESNDTYNELPEEF